MKQFKDNTPGRAWWLGFLSRHPDLNLKNTKTLDVSRAAAFSEEKIRHGHMNYEALLHVYNIDSPEQIANCDESGFSLQTKGSKILTSRNPQNPHFLTGPNKSQITALLSITASGKVLPPYMLFSGKSVNPSCALDLPSNSKCFATDSGWMTQDAFYGWMEHVFIPFWPPPLN